MKNKVAALFMVFGFLGHTQIQFAWGEGPEDDLNSINDTLNNNPSWKAMDTDKKQATIEQAIESYYDNDKRDPYRRTNLTPAEKRIIANRISATLPKPSDNENDWVVIDSPTKSEESVGQRAEDRTPTPRTPVNATRGIDRTASSSAIKEQALTKSTQLIKDLTENMITNENMPFNIKKWNASLFTELFDLQTEIKENSWSPDVGQERLASIISAAKNDIRNALKKNQTALAKSGLNAIFDILNRY